MLLLTILTLTSVSYVSSFIVQFNGSCSSANWSCEKETMIYDCQNNTLDLDEIEIFIWYKQFSPDIHHFIVRNCHSVLMHVDQISVLQLKKTKRQVTVDDVEELLMDRSSVTGGEPVVLPDVIKLQNIRSLRFANRIMNSTNEVELHLNDVTYVVYYREALEWLDLPRLSLYLENGTVGLAGGRKALGWSFEGLHHLSMIGLHSLSHITISNVNQVVMKNITITNYLGILGLLLQEKNIVITEVPKIHIEGNKFPSKITWLILGTSNTTIDILNNTDLGQNILIKGNSVNFNKNNITSLENVHIYAKQLTMSKNNFENVQDNQFFCEIVNITSNTMTNIGRQGFSVLNNNKTFVENNNITITESLGLVTVSDHVSITGNTFKLLQNESFLFITNDPTLDEFHSYFTLQSNLFNYVSPSAFMFYHQFYHVQVFNNTFLCRCGSRNWFENVNRSKSLNLFNHTFIESLMMNNNSNKCVNRDCAIGFYVDHFDQLCIHNNYQPDTCTVNEQSSNLAHQQEKTINEQTDTVHHQHSLSPLLTFLLVCVVIGISVFILMKVKCKNIKYSRVVNWSNRNSSLQRPMNADVSLGETNVSLSSESLPQSIVRL